MRSNRRLSAELMAALASAGWTEDRHIDPSALLGPLLQRGLDVVPAGTAILEALGGLVLPLALGTVTAAEEQAMELVEFDPGRAIEWDLVQGNLEDWTQRAGEAVTPIASVVDQPMIYLAGASGSIYVSYGQLLYRIGSDIWDALQSRLDNGESVEL